MEILTQNFAGAVARFYPEQSLKNFYLCGAETLTNLASQVAPTSSHYGLFLAMDSRNIESRQILEAAESLIPKGLAYLCAWGPDCERVHDCFDEILSEADPESTEADVVMTTWHDDESLEEALSYFANSAGAAANYAASCKDWIAAVIGNQDWQANVREFLSNPSGKE